MTTWDHKRLEYVTDILMDKPEFENKKVVLNADFTATTFKFVERAPSQAGATPTSVQ